MNENLLFMLMQRPYSDFLNGQDYARRQQQLTQQQNSTAFRNVGPSNLTQFPDRNAYTPDETMRYRMQPQSWGEGI